MLTGKELGAAIAFAIKLKMKSTGISKKDIADHFGIKPPSIYDWIKKGSISKDKLPELWRFFSDVVGPEHWGLKSWPVPLDESEHANSPIQTLYDSSDKATRDLIDWLLESSISNSISPGTSEKLLALLRGLSPARPKQQNTDLIKYLNREK